MQRAILTLIILTLSSLMSFSQEVSTRQLKNLILEDLQGTKRSLPSWGNNYLVVFYVDPDRAGLNKLFVDDMEQNRRINTPRIRPVGVINLKDAPKIPTKLAYAMAEKRTEGRDIKILVDNSRTLSTEWGLGDCNNQFALIVINLAGEAIFIRKGVLSQEDIDDFYSVITRIQEGNTTSLEQGSGHL